MVKPPYRHIIEVIGAAGAKRGEHLCLQSSLKSIATAGCTAEVIIKALQQLVGTEGTIIMPTYNFHSWTEHHYFNLLETPSEVGALTELFRKSEGVKRTRHPIHSLAVWGRLAEELCDLDPVNSFGSDSLFAYLERLDILYLTAGTGLAMPFLPCHHSEYVAGVGYRTEKVFRGDYVDERGTASRQYSFDAKKEECRTLVSPVYEGHLELFRQGVVKQIDLNGTRVCFSSASEYHRAFVRFVKEHPALFWNT